MQVRLARFSYSLDPWTVFPFQSLARPKASRRPLRPPMTCHINPVLLPLPLPLVDSFLTDSHPSTPFASTYVPSPFAPTPLSPAPTYTMKTLLQ